MSIRSPRSPAENSAGRSMPRAEYSSRTSCGNFTACCSPMGGLRSSTIVNHLVLRSFYQAGSKRMTTDLLAGVLLVSAVESSGTSTLVSG